MFCLIDRAGHLPSWALREVGFRGTLRKPVKAEGLKAALTVLKA